MADLAKTQKPVAARTQKTRNRDTLLPSRRDTRAPRLEVNAPLTGGNGSKGQRLAEILGVAQQAGNAALGLARERDAVKREDARSQAAIDASSGVDGSGNYSGTAGAAYERAFAETEAVRTATTLHDETTELVQQRLNDIDDPATIEDINDIIEQQFAKAALSEDGQPLPMHPAAQRVLARGMAKTRGEILGPAMEKIREQTNTRHADNVAFKVIREGIPELGFAAPPKPEATAAADPDSPEWAKQFDEAFREGDSKVPLTTGKPPIPGIVTSDFAAHQARGSKGVDLDGEKGDPIELPAAGTVIDANFDRENGSGNYIVVDHGGGLVSTYSHLDARHVKRGDVVDAGTIIGTVGNTGNVRSSGGGDGSHLHWRVKVNGEDVDPLSYNFAGSVTEAARAQQPSFEFQKTVDAAAPVALDFEPIMAQRPPSMSAKEWKNKMLPALVLHAEEAGRPDILRGLSLSARPDGTPSFNPTEIGYLRDNARQLETRMREETKRAEAERFEANETQILDAFSNDNDPSIAQLRQARADGHISARFAASMINSIETEREQEERYQTALDKQAEREADEIYDAEVAAKIVARRSGLLEDASAEEDLELFENGSLGTGKKARIRYTQLRTAATNGRQFLEQTEDGQIWAARIREAFPRPTVGTSLTEQLLGTTGGVGSQEAAMSRYRKNIEGGMSPPEAAREAIDHYKKQDAKGGGSSQLDRDRAELEALLGKQ